MENASKALLMAGALLLAMIVISAFILGYSNITELAQSKTEEELRKETENYNAQYLAFNKNVMYGTDVVSILNLAISNNAINNVRAGEELYIDIAFELKKDSISDIVYEYRLNPKTAMYTSKILGKNTSSYGAGNFSFEINHTYSLSSNNESIAEFLKTANKAEETKNVLEFDGATEIRYTITYSGMADFKRKTFKCSKVEYDRQGRVNYIKFEQI